MSDKTEMKDNDLETRLLDDVIRLQFRTVDQLLATERFEEAKAVMKRLGVSQKEIKKLISLIKRWKK